MVCYQFCPWETPYVSLGGYSNGIALSKQSVGTPRAELIYTVGTSLLHEKGLKLYNRNTKREIVRIVRGTLKPLGPVRPIVERATYGLHADDTIEEIPIVLQEPSHNVNDYNF